MYIAILGRQPAIGMAELEHLYGAESTRWFSEQSATVKTDSLPIERLGSTQKVGRVVFELPHGDWQRASMKIVQAYREKWSNVEGKITLGISAYGFSTTPHDVQRTGILLKQKLKKDGVSLRAIPNQDTALNTATAHHNKLGLSSTRVEIIAVRAKNGRIIIAESEGSQNITSLARRDQGRPKRDAFVGMLPPKLAMTIINLAAKSTDPTDHTKRLLDPFCGTGVVLQEASLMGYQVYGTDLAEKMIDFSKINLEWLNTSLHTPVKSTLTVGDAMTTTWSQPIDAVACESYLGQPFSAPPSPAKLAEVRKNCNYIISSFLKNIGSQLRPGTPLCVAIPAWKDTNGTFTHLPLVNELESLGFEPFEFRNISPEQLLYHRENQVVARQLLVITKS